MTWYKVAKDGNMKDGDLAKVNVDGNEVLIIKDGENRALLRKTSA